MTFSTIRVKRGKVARRNEPLRAAFSVVFAAALVSALLAAVHVTRAAAVGPCGPPVVSTIACENSLPGDPPSDWQITGAGDPSIQGFATTMSVNKGQTVSFKVSTPARSYHLDILRLGYYQGSGARKVAAGLRPTVPLPQAQPACLTDSSTGLVDCGNWRVSVSWMVPSSAVSGIYAAHLVRDDGGLLDSQIVFVVRDDASHSNIVVQTSDTTWQAYNTYGGNSLYRCTVACPPGNPQGYKAAYKVSYNRPFNSAVDDQGRDWVYYAEFPMMRFLEANGYDVSYMSGSDVDSKGPLLLNHKAFISSGHDEYWSGNQRANVEAARAAGVNLAFFSGNESFWKTRWEPAIDGSNTASRTLVSYKETHFDAPTDPKDPTVWTGTWRDPRFSPPADGGRPENALSGQYFLVNFGSTDIQVPAQYAKLRLWRNTAVATLAVGQSLTLGAGINTLGYEWDGDMDNGFRPAGLFDLSSTTLSGGAETFADYGSNTIAGSTATHHLTLYRSSSNALVFGAGTVQWSWGLDSANRSGKAPDITMQQATVNLLADMSAQPASLHAGLVAATKSTDTTAPTSTIKVPVLGSGHPDGALITVSGTAADKGGGVVAGVEVSTDGGSTWHPATGTANWTYNWVAHGYPSTTIRSRAVDDNGNLETPSTGLTVNVTCPCSVWGPNVAPATVDSGDPTALELGVKFTSEVAGTVSGIRFHKAAANTGTHIGNLWTASGQLLAQATFAAESASGWQEVTFADPVAILANTMYVASYFAPQGHYSGTNEYFYPAPAPAPNGGGVVDSRPLHALRNGASGPNGVYAPSGTSVFPSYSYNASNYWVDVVFSPAGSGGPTVPAAATGVAATAGDSSAVVTWTAPASGGSPITGYKVTPFAGLTAQPSTVVGVVTGITVKGLTNGTAYTFVVSATNAVGTGPLSAPSAPVTPQVAGVPSCPCSIFGSAIPPVIDSGDWSSVELGVQFTSDANGFVSGVRFYKAAANTGTHIGQLWTSGGALLASATFTNETGSGWQQVTFASPVATTAGTTYVASYLAPNGHYSDTGAAFASAGIDAPPLHALANSTSANGVYIYTNTQSFPSYSYNATNYWVDPVFTP